MTENAKTIRKQIIDRIHKARRILIVSHRDPDGDALGSVLAMHNFLSDTGKESLPVINGKLPYKYRLLPGIDKIISADQIADSAGKFDLALVVDSSDLERIGPAAGLIDDTTEIINIDHHPDNAGFGRINLVDSSASSVGEIIAELFMEIDYPVSPDTASLLYAAIMTDTGRFRFQSTGRRSMELAGWLIGRGVNPRAICDKIYYSVPPAVLRLTGELLIGMEFFENDRICLMGLPKDKYDRIGAGLNDTEGLAEYSLFGQNVVVGGLLKDMGKDGIKVSLRSRDSINVSSLAHKYGGGGHANAAGFISHHSLDDTRRMLLEDLKELVNDEVRRNTAV